MWKNDSKLYFKSNEAICENMTFIGKQNFRLEPKTCSGVKKADFQIFMEISTTCIKV